MLKMLFTILIFIIWVLIPLSADVINPDKPLKGQWDMKPALCWKVQKANSTQILKISSFNISENGNIYLFDSSHNSFFVFNQQGKFLFRFGKQGEGPGEYRNVFTTYITNKKIVALAMRRLHLYELDGTPLESISIPFDFPRFFIDSKRYLRIKKDDAGKSSKDMLSIFNSNTLKEQIIATVKYEKLLTGKGGGVTLHVSLPDFTGGVISAFHEGSVYYGYNSRYSIERIDLTGKKLMQFSVEGRDKAEITRKKKRAALENISFNGGRIPDTMMKTMIKNIPDEAPYFNKIHIEKNGFIYVYVNDMRTNRQAIDIFSENGRYLYSTQFELPVNLTIKGHIKIWRNSIFVYIEDEEGETELRKYRVNLPL